MPRPLSVTACNCDDAHPLNAVKKDGTELAQWKCPVHGNVFGEKRPDIVLSELQRQVLSLISKGHKRGKELSVDDISKQLNASRASVGISCSVLMALGFIETLPHT